MKVIAKRTFIKDRVIMRGEVLEMHENYVRRNPHLVMPFVGPSEIQKDPKPEEIKKTPLPEKHNEEDIDVVQGEDIAEEVDQAGENTPEDETSNEDGDNQEPEKLLIDENVVEDAEEDEGGQENKDNQEDEEQEPEREPDLNDEEPEGVTMTYKCLDCGRDDFKTKQGLLAHKRFCKGGDPDGSDQQEA